MKSLSLRNLLYLTPLVLMVSLYTLLPNRYSMHDAIAYAIAFQDGSILAQGLWHPSHLLYGPLGYILFQAQQSLGLALTPLQVYSCLGTLTSSFISFFLIQLFLLSGISLFNTVVSLLVWTGSYAVWHSSTSSDLARNMLAILFLIASFYTILHGTTHRFKQWPLIAGLLIGLSGLFHVLSVFAVPALCLFLYGRVPKNRLLPVSLLIFSLSATLILISYLLTATAIHQINDIAGFVQWFSGPGTGWWQLNPLRGCLDLFITALRGILGIVTYAPLKEAILSAGGKEISILAFAIISFVILSYLSFRIFYFLISSFETISPLSKAMLSWLFLHGILAVVFDPGNIRMLIYLSVPFITIFGESLTRVRSSLNRRITILISLLLIFINAVTVMRTESNPQSQAAFQKLACMNTASQNPDDLFLVLMSTDALYAQYFGQRRAVKTTFNELCHNNMLDLMQATWKRGSHVFLDKEIVHKAHPNSPLKDICNSKIKVFDSVPGKPKNAWFELRKDMS
jgi:hypothetical protein